REGKVYDTDKFMWLQGRQVWCFAMLYNLVEEKQEWLDFAVHGADFIEKYGRDEAGDWYFSLTRQGQPLVQPYNIFSDCFAAMGFGQLYKATNREVHKEIAVRTFYRILNRIENPKGKYSKVVQGTRSLKGLSLPMILSNLVLEIEHVLPPEVVERTIRNCIHDVMGDFYHPESGLMLENITDDGAYSDSYEGRMIMPGHSLESMWFLMDIAVKENDQELIRKAVDISLNLIEYGWDRQYGGIFYVLDIKGHPPQHLEWDQKLWWVHLEALVAMLKGYYLTGDERCLTWFEKIHDYTWSHFPDKEGGEWFGYLNRRGEVLLPLKGGKWKGCFHVPRCLYQAWNTLELILTKQHAVIG
ncbi:MAG TPA: AGE family epimerase/isomerase, partial [Puia sp.]|nr:AGE family epimerase/isomerase [Puia sp.]